MTWPGDAAVSVAVVHLHFGKWNGLRILDAKVVSAIGASLGALDGTIEPVRLKQRIDYSQGTNLFGRAFVLDEAERQRWLRDCPPVGKYLRNYMNGNVFGESPTGVGDLWVIDFGSLDQDSLNDCMPVVKYLSEAISVERSNQTRQIHEHRPWLHWDKRESFYESARKLTRIIGCVSPSRFLVFQFVDPNHLFDIGVRLFRSDKFDDLAILQSGIHEAWAYATSSKLGNSLRYLTSATFDTFPFPRGSDDLARIGEEYHSLRRDIMIQSGDGPTRLYSRFHSAADLAMDIGRLRDLHRTLDCVVAESFGWQDIDFEHGFHETKHGNRYTISEAARNNVLARLSKLNSRRKAEEEAEALVFGTIAPVKRGRKSKAVGGQATLDL
jgi:hypothetical protein